jgi:cold shock CspA family protein/ribosome-associated translation inhibitor RaiA
MQIPLHINFHNMDRSPALEAKVREKTDRLQKFCAGIVGCSVEIEAPHHHHHQGNLYRVRMRITVPDREITVTRRAAEDHAHEDPYVALRDAFRAARRQLEDYSRTHRGDVKSHSVPPHGRVASFESKSGRGSIMTPDGREIRFHRNSVVQTDLKRVRKGADVTFSETTDEQGPFATTVHVLGKQHPAG